MTDSDLAWRSLGKSASIAEDLVVAFYVEERKRRVSVARVQKRLYAFDDLCTCGAEPCPLSGGLLTRATIMCQCHGSEFDIVTGAVTRGPAAEPLHVYAVEEADGMVRIRL